MSFCHSHHQSALKGLFFVLFIGLLQGCTTSAGLPGPAITKVSLASQSPPISAQKVEITLTAVGDIMLGTDYPDDRLPTEDGKALFADVAPVLSQADISFGNLEGTFGTAGEATKPCLDVKHCYVFRMPPRYAEYLRQAGFDVMSLANNHARDFGDRGREMTMAVLDKAGIQHSGIAGDIARFRFKEKNIVLIAFAPFRGAHDFLDLEYAETVIQNLARQFDIVLVSFHGGAEGKDKTRIPFVTEYFYGENRGDVVKFAHTVIDAGADVVLGHGPHVPRALELYRDRLIAYSLGNFCTTLGINVVGINGLAPILSVTIDGEGRFVSGKVTSAVQRRPHGPQLDDQHRVARLMAELTRQDFPNTALDMDAQGNITRKPTAKTPHGTRYLPQTNADKPALDE